MSPCYWKDSAVKLFPWGHFRIPLVKQPTPVSKVTSRCADAGTRGVVKFRAWRHKTSPFEFEMKANGAKTETNCPSNYCFFFVCLFVGCFRCLLATQTWILSFITNSISRLQHATSVFNQQFGITTYQWGWRFMVAKVLFIGNILLKWN